MRIVEVEVDGMYLHREIYITRSKEHPLTSAQIEFWNFITTADVELLVPFLR